MQKCHSERSEESDRATLRCAQGDRPAVPIFYGERRENENLEDLPFVLSLSQHKHDFFSSLLSPSSGHLPETDTLPSGRDTDAGAAPVVAKRGLKSETIEGMNTNAPTTCKNRIKASKNAISA